MHFDIIMPDINKFVTRLKPVLGKDSLRRAAEDLARTTAYRMFEELRAATPEKTGATRDAWELRRTGPKEWRISNDMRTIEWLLKGTAPHDIVATHAPALHFTIGGSEFFAQAVFHPGSRPDQALVRAWQDVNSGSKLDLSNLKAHVLEHFA